MTDQNYAGYNRVPQDRYDAFVDNMKRDDRLERHETTRGNNITVHYTLYASPREVKAIANLWGFELVADTLKPSFHVSAPVVFHKEGLLADTWSLNLTSIMTNYVEEVLNVQV